jgi:hypothetical protein
MSYPRKYPVSGADPHLQDLDWNAMVDRINGFTPEGIFQSPYSFLILKNKVDGTDYYYANNAFQTVYGGPDNQGEPPVDGTDASAVIQAAINNAPTGSRIAFRTGDSACATRDYECATPLNIPDQKTLHLLGEHEYYTVFKYTGESEQPFFTLTDRNQGTTVENLTILGANADPALYIDYTVYQSLITLKNSHIGWNYYRVTEERSNTGMVSKGCDVFRAFLTSFEGDATGCRIGSGMDYYFTDCQWGALSGVGTPRGLWCNTDNGDGTPLFEGTCFINGGSANAPGGRNFHFRSRVFMRGTYTEWGNPPIEADICKFYLSHCVIGTADQTATTMLYTVGGEGSITDCEFNLPPDEHSLTSILNQTFSSAGTKINVIGNIINGTLPDPVFAGDAGTFRNVKNNPDYVTENWGVAEIKSQDAIVHGLDGTPTFFLVHVAENDDLYHCQEYDSQPDHFHVLLWDNEGIEIVENKTVMWYAAFFP